MRKTQVLMNKPVYLSLSVLDLSKIVMYEIWYDYVKPKYAENAKLSYTVTDSFIHYQVHRFIALSQLNEKSLTIKKFHQSLIFLLRLNIFIVGK